MRNAASVSCTAAGSGQKGPCWAMDVYSGARGAAVTCAEAGGAQGGSTTTCQGLTLHAPDAAARPAGSQKASLRGTSTRRATK